MSRMATLHPRQCAPNAWKGWTLDGLRLVLRRPLFFCGWVALCLGRGWAITRIVSDHDIVGNTIALLILAMPEPCIAWVACRRLSIGMVPGRRAAHGWLGENLRALSATGVLWRMIFTLGWCSFIEALAIQYGAKGWGSRFSLGAVPAIIAMCWFAWSMRINLAEWGCIPDGDARRLSLRGVVLNFRSFVIQSLLSLAMLAVLFALPVRNSLGWQGLSAGAAVFGALFLMAWNTCAMHDIFDTGEKVREKQPAQARAGSPSTACRATP